MRDIKDFGLFIANKRKELGMTQENLANIIGITPQAVSKWENGIGYPDVTLFSDIAKALNVSVSELFGEEIKTGFVVPNTYRELPKIYENEHSACYSSKVVERIVAEEGKILFKDGSYAEIIERCVYNQGTGEVHIVSVEELKNDITPKNNEKRVEKPIETFDSVELVVGGGSNEIFIEKSSSPKLEFRGTENFIKAFESSVENRKLSVLQKWDSGNREKGKIIIKAPFEKGNTLHVNLGGNNTVETYVDFGKTNLFTSGNSSINGQLTDSLYLKVSGNSSVEYNTVKNDAVFEISGNSSISVKKIGKSKIKVSGNSSMAFLDVQNDMDIRVSGNSAISASGEIDSLKCEFSGNGEFDGKNLTVKTAEITITSKGKVYLKHIKKCSVERLGLHGKLYVEKRG